MSSTSHSLASEVWGLPEKWTPMTIAPRRAMRHEATGESMPLESSETMRPELPTGRPPTPALLRA